MKNPPVLEKTVVNRIMAALKKVPGVVVRKRHGTAFGVAGDPDIYGTINGRHFEIEVKRPDDRSRPTALQLQRMEEWKVQGKALVGVARSVEDALVILGLRQPESHWVCEGCGNYTWRGHEPPDRCPTCGHRHFKEEPRGWAA
jgi:hypothetical protein